MVAEGRSFIRHSPARWDIIQLTGVDTLAALSTGAYMLAESYLYTVEAFTEYLGHLSADGTLSFMIGDKHWKTGQARFSLRHVANFLAAAERLGIENPATHVAIVARAGKFAMIELLFKPRPFTAAEVATLETFARDRDFELWHLPGVAPATPPAELLVADAAERQRLLAAYPLNVHATADDRPFFFHFYRWRDLVRPARWEVDTGHELATGQLVLGAILVVALVTSLAFVIGPLLLTRRYRGRGAARYALYFAGIGLGFMLVEVSLIQHFILFLGHPTYSIAIILLALLTWAGLGSWVSGRLAAGPRAIVGAALAVLLALLALYAWGLPAVFARWLGASPAARYVLTVVLLAPLGLVLGVFFPTGLHDVRQHDELLVAWAWGANGASSVVGSILSIVLAISLGFRAVLGVAAVIYLVAGAAFLAGRGRALSLDGAQADRRQRLR